MARMTCTQHLLTPRKPVLGPKVAIWVKRDASGQGTKEAGASVVNIMMGMGRTLAQRL